MQYRLSDHPANNGESSRVIMGQEFHRDEWITMEADSRFQSFLHLLEVRENTPTEPEVIDESPTLEKVDEPTSQTFDEMTKEQLVEYILERDDSTAKSRLWRFKRDDLAELAAQVEDW